MITGSGGGGSGGTGSSGGRPGGGGGGRELPPEKGGGGSGAADAEKQKKKDDFDKLCDELFTKGSAGAEVKLNGMITGCNNTYNSSWLSAPIGSVINLALLGIPLKRCIDGAYSDYKFDIANLAQDNRTCKGNNPYK